MAAEAKTNFPSWRWLGAVVALALGLYASIALGGLLSVPDPPNRPLSLLWPAPALAFYVLARHGLRFWPALALADLLVGLYRPFSDSPLSWTTTLAMMCGDVAGATLGALAVRRFTSGANPLRLLRNVVVLVVAGALGAPAIGTLVSVAILRLNPPSTLPIDEVFNSWWLPQALETLLYTTILWVPWRKPRATPGHGRPAEAVLLAFYVAAAGYLTLLQRAGSESWHMALPFFLFPAIPWAAIRFGERGNALVLATVVALGLAGVYARTGPFSTTPVQPGISALNAYLIVLCVAGLLMSSALTERTDIERSLAESERKYRNLVETSGDLIWSVDAEGRFTFVNHAAVRTHGYTPQEMIGKPFVDFICGEEQLARDLATFQRIKAGESFFRYQTVHRRKDGEPATLEFNAIVLRDPQGNVVGSTGTATDVTEKAESERRIRASEARFRSIFENSPIGIYISRDRKPLYINEACARVFGYASAAEMLQIPQVELLAESEREAARLRTQRREAGSPSPPSYESVGQRRDGTQFPLAVSVEEVTLPEGTATVAFLSDLTEQRGLEAQLRQSQKMEAVGRLAGGVAHDFNNLLTVILGYCELLRESLSPDDPRVKGIDEMTRAGERASALTQQLLSFSRKQVVHPQRFDLNERLHSMVSLLRRLIGEDIHLATDLASSAATIHADPSQIDQLLLNLAVNARDAMPRGGTLTISTRRERFPEGRGAFSGDAVLLAVRDTGIGMDPETVSHLFEPFFTTKADGKGTGLGMATVYGIVQQAGGHIAVASEVGKGTTVEVHLPFAAGALAEGEAAEAPAEADPPRRATVLLVEDEDLVRQLGREALESRGFRVLEAASGAEALAVCASRLEPIDLVVTDVVMPKMGGPELAKRLATVIPQAKILYVSGYTGGRALEVGLAEHDAQLLAKPFTPRQLVERVTALLKKA